MRKCGREEAAEESQKKQLIWVESIDNLGIYWLRFAASSARFQSESCFWVTFVRIYPAISNFDQPQSCNPVDCHTSNSNEEIWQDTGRLRGHKWVIKKHKINAYPIYPRFVLPAYSLLRHSTTMIIYYWMEMYSYSKLTEEPAFVYS